MRPGTASVDINRLLADNIDTMRATIASLVASAIFEFSAIAGVEASKAVVFDEPAWEETMRVSMFGTYRHTLTSGTTNADDFGAGLSVYAPLGQAGAGVELGYGWQAGDLTDVHSAQGALRFNVANLGPVTGYLLAGASYKFTGSEDGWSYDAGLGAELRLMENISLFADWRYALSDSDAIGDTGQARLGGSIKF